MMRTLIKRAWTVNIITRGSTSRSGCCAKIFWPSTGSPPRRTFRWTLLHIFWELSGDAFTTLSTFSSLSAWWCAAQKTGIAGWESRGWSAHSLFLMQQQDNVQASFELTSRAGSASPVNLAVADQLDSIHDSRKEKALGVLSQKFVQLFLRAPGEAISLDQAAASLFGKSTKPKSSSLAVSEGNQHEEVECRDDDDDEDDTAKVAGKPLKSSAASTHMKTRVRRLYDVANILASLQLIVKTQSLSRKPAFRWCGPVGNNLLSMSQLDDDAVQPTRFNAPVSGHTPKKRRVAETCEQSLSPTKFGGDGGIDRSAEQALPSACDEENKSREALPARHAGQVRLRQQVCGRRSVQETAEQSPENSRQDKTELGDTLLRWKGVLGPQALQQVTLDAHILQAVAEYEKSLVEKIGSAKSSSACRESDASSSGCTEGAHRAHCAADYEVMNEDEVNEYMMKARAAGPEFLAQAQLWQAKFELWKSYHRSLSRAKEQCSTASTANQTPKESGNAEAFLASEVEHRDASGCDATRGAQLAAPSEAWQLQFQREQQLLWACALAKLSEKESDSSVRQCSI
mmetsp:Transcript_8775/g.23003  ORF Transcript_8775/g.23003 Transcript_8775/m.23003 type:complete len:571 (-) Transcript_8775:755-2467(-)